MGEIILAHLVGDYLLQSGWMASKKKQHWSVATVHGLLYTLPFYVLTRAPWALMAICGTHIIIDRWQLAHYVCWAREQLAPREARPSRSAITSNYGSHPATPNGVAHTLKVVIDNVMHLLCNVAALTWLA